MRALPEQGRLPFPVGQGLSVPAFIVPQEGRIPVPSVPGVSFPAQAFLQSFRAAVRPLAQKSRRVPGERHRFRPCFIRNRCRIRIQFVHGNHPDFLQGAAVLRADRHPGELVASVVIEAPGLFRILLHASRTQAQGGDHPCFRHVRAGAGVVPERRVKNRGLLLPRQEQAVERKQAGRKKQLLLVNRKTQRAENVLVVLQQIVFQDPP